jgi:low affinity Fe/Cu permease
VQLTLDELIRSHQAAHNWLLDLEKLSESDLERLRKTFAGLAERAREGGTAIEELQRDEKSGDRS